MQRKVIINGKQAYETDQRQTTAALAGASTFVYEGLSREVTAHSM